MVQPEPAANSPMALWGLVQWLGQLSPAQLNLALGVEPPSHIIEDEKHMKECGQKVYVPIVYAPKKPLELAGANFLGLPWMQLVNLVLCAWPTLAFAANVFQVST